MLFSSTVFVCAFFPLFFLIYYLVRNRTAQNYVLLVFSLFFYAWGEPLYLILLVLAAFVGWASSLIIDKFKRGGKAKAAKAALVIALIYNLGMLGVYKYTGFAVETVNSLTGSKFPVPEIALPIGISFFTFQIISYIVDVYRSDVAAQRNFGTVAVYLCAFPQLIAGPVVRYKTIETELTERNVTFEDTYAGLRRFICGLAKKVLIANTVASVADGLFSYSPNQYGVVGAWLAVGAYTIQIYFDFSGYSDMAIGMGRMMGFKYLENFDDPYTAVSVTDFWRRWHISMSSFFRDYVYIPMGGNRVSMPRWILNIAVVWALTGLWHGASWNFVVWGLYYGLLLVLEKLLWGKAVTKIPVVRNIYTMLAVMAGWTVFRAETLTETGQIFKALVGGYGLGNSPVSFLTIFERSGVGGTFVLAMIAGIVLSCGAGKRIAAKVDALEKPAMWQAAYNVASVALLVVSVASIASGAYNPFIYFRF